MNIYDGKVIVDKEIIQATNNIIFDGQKIAFELRDRMGDDVEMPGLFEHTSCHAAIFPGSLLKKKKNVSLKNNLKETKIDREMEKSLFLQRTKLSEHDLRTILQFLCVAFPMSLFRGDGCMRTSAKSSVLRWFSRKFVAPLDHRPVSPPTRGFSKALLIDLMCRVRRMKVSHLKWFKQIIGMFCEEIIEGSISYNDTHVLPDAYEPNGQEKDLARDKRGGGAQSQQWLRIKGNGDKTKIPKGFSSTYMNSKFNKMEFVDFIQHQCLEIVPRFLGHGKRVFIARGNKTFKIENGETTEVIQLRSIQKEADYRLMPHARHAAANHDRVDTVPRTQTHFFWHVIGIMIFLGIIFVLIGNAQNCMLKCCQVQKLSVIPFIKLCIILV